MSRRRASSPKVYDRAYFDRWYRDPRHAVIHRHVLARRVQLAVSAAEYLLERQIRNVLDVGCGEAPWRALLRHARPRVQYVGVDSSTYAVQRFGKTRNILLGRFGDLGRLRLNGPFDLIVCSDVLHYVDKAEAQRGLRAMRRLLGGLAFIELFTGDDETVGDDDEYQRLSAAAYRKMFRAAGFVHLGLHCYTHRDMARDLTVFELGQW